MKKSKRPGINSKLKYDEDGNIIVGTFKNEEHHYYNAYCCGTGYFKDKSEKNRKGKAAQKARNKLKQGNYDD